MPKTAVQTPVCDICGSDAREGSLFCYNCGGSLKQIANDEPEAAREIPTQPVAAANGASKGTPPERRGSRRRRASSRGPVEIVWEPKSGFSIAYVIGAAVLLGFALLLFIAAVWLK